MGGGCGIALACDFRLADPASRFGITPAKLGLLYSERDTRRLHRLVGPALTRRMLFTGAALSGEQALAAGLVTAAAIPWVAPGVPILLAAALGAAWGWWGHAR